MTTTTTNATQTAYLTKMQRDALERIKVVQKQQMDRGWQSIKDMGADAPAHARPTDWVSVVCLINTHGIWSSTISLLVRKGLLERTSNDINGPVVRPVV